MNQTDMDTSAAATGILSRAKGLLDTLSGRAKAIADKGKQTVADRQIARQRRDLLLELGELYYESLAAGRDGPSKGVRERLIADLDALDPLGAEDRDPTPEDTTGEGR